MGDDIAVPSGFAWDNVPCCWVYVCLVCFLRVESACVKCVCDSFKWLTFDYTGTLFVAVVSGYLRWTGW